MALLPDAKTVKSIMAKVCERNDVPGLEDKVKVDWNARFTRRMGDACLSRMQIRLSPKLFVRASEKEQENTIAHEMAHIVAEYKFGTKIAPHGGEWQSCMLRAGYEPSCYHNVDRTGLARTHKTCITYCGCGKHMVTPKKYAKIKRGVKYTCRKCGEHLALIAVIPRPTVVNLKPTYVKPAPIVVKPRSNKIVVTSVNVGAKKRGL